MCWQPGATASPTPPPPSSPIARWRRRFWAGRRDEDFRLSLPPPTPTRPRKGGGGFGERCFYTRPLDGGGPGWGWVAGPSAMIDWSALLDFIGLYLIPGLVT